MTSTLPFRSPFDRLFYALVARGRETNHVTSYRARMRQYMVELPTEVIDSLRLIDGKGTGLLTHVSLMIAGLGLVAPLVATHELEIGVVLFEIGIYLLIAVGCLRCLAVLHVDDPNATQDQVLQIAERELFLRRELYRICISSSIIFTALVFLMLPVLYFWKPGAAL